MSRQSAKNRQIATPSTSWMRDIFEMIHVQYQKNPFIIVGEVAFWKKFTKQIYKQTRKVSVGARMTRQPSFSEMG